MSTPVVHRKKKLVTKSSNLPKEIYTKSIQLRSSSPERKKKAVNFLKEHRDYVFPSYTTNQGFNSTFSVVSDLDLDERQRDTVLSQFVFNENDISPQKNKVQEQKTSKNDNKNNTVISENIDTKEKDTKNNDKTEDESKSKSFHSSILLDREPGKNLNLSVVRQQSQDISPISTESPQKSDNEKTVNQERNETQKVIDDNKLSEETANTENISENNKNTEENKESDELKQTNSEKEKSAEMENSESEKPQNSSESSIIKEKYKEIKQKPLDETPETNEPSKAENSPSTPQTNKTTQTELSFETQSNDSPSHRDKRKRHHHKHRSPKRRRRHHHHRRPHSHRRRDYYSSYDSDYDYDDYDYDDEYYSEYSYNERENRRSPKRKQEKSKTEESPTKILMTPTSPIVAVDYKPQSIDDIMEEEEEKDDYYIPSPYIGAQKNQNQNEYPLNDTRYPPTETQEFRESLRIGGRISMTESKVSLSVGSSAGNEDTFLDFSPPQAASSFEVNKGIYEQSVWMFLPLDEDGSLSKTAVKKRREQYMTPNYSTILATLRSMFAGTENEGLHIEIGRIMTAHQREHFLILVGSPDDAKAVYVCGKSKLERIWGTGPETVDPKSVNKFWQRKGKSLQQITTDKGISDQKVVGFSCDTPNE